MNDYDRDRILAFGPRNHEEAKTAAPKVDESEKCEHNKGTEP